ncbi:hypothetical protein AAX26_01577 [Aliarcobacter thereius]|uniref:Uncharacterized protein n=1 Tax=Aliarcobacter thereius TaxID=544718 RepID=A0A5R9H2I0_9BACT|nr:hypothetical protein [Aliarcobacter thereius]OCL86444.1 hypothetical protein AAX26_01577 [Aliarcobacter thereius]TLS71354.1 hypothetical protein FE246_07000 [Aliarcobacter thereius]
MKNKIFILLFFIGSFIIFLTLPLFNYINDQWRVLTSDYEKYYEGIEPNKSFLKTKYLLENKEKYEILLMGSSRIGNFDSKLISEKAYNMTYSFGHISNHLNNLKVLIKNDVKIKKIILGIDDFYIFKNPKDFDTDYLRKNYKDDIFGKIDFYKFYLFKKPTDRDVDLFFKKYSLIESNQIINPSDMNGRNNREMKIKSDLDNHKNKLNNIILLGYNENFRTNEVLNEIKRFKELCNLYNIELITIMFPQFYNVYLSYNQYEIEKFKTNLAQITSFYDFYNLFDYTFEEKYWFDTSHFVPTIGNKILNDVFENKNLVTSQNVEDKISTSRIYLKNLFYKDLNQILKINNNINFPNLNSIFDISKDKYSKNDHLELLLENNNIKLNAIKNDPIIILNQIKTNSKNVILNYELESNIDTTFQLFYKKENNSKFNEIDSYKIAIKKGNNEINLLIPSEYINNGLRVDLVSTLGSYDIKSFRIYDK